MSASRVLVVDDQEEIREMTAMILSGAGYEVRTAAGGEEALREARRASFDVVLLDINMPGMGGWETLRLMRQDEALADLVVAMFSVKGEVRDKTAGLQYGASDYITKPFAVDDLVRRVARLVRARI
jgi:DNA-binding response OmpR family regulator